MSLLLIFSLLAGLLNMMPPSVSETIEPIAELATYSYLHWNDVYRFPDPSLIEGAVIHQPIPLENVYQGEVNIKYPVGEARGFEPNTLVVNGHPFYYTDLKGNRGYGEDFETLNEALGRNEAVRVGKRGIETFFGHYYNLSDNGVFNPLHDQDLLHIGSEVIVTNEEGLSKGYYITQTIEFLHANQGQQFYGDYYMPQMAYNGTGEELVYIQYCRWDIELGLLITNIGHRIW